MEGYRRARTSYDFLADMPHEEYSPYLPLDDHVTMPGLRRRSRPTTRNAGYDMGIQTDRPRMPENPYTGHMDPVNRQYYYRQWKQTPPSPRPPIYRSGRLGSPWRHIKACINNGGNHLVFIDGTVKTEENFFYPPEEMMEPPDLSMLLSPRFTRAGGRPKRSSSFSDRAKQGFQYWYKDSKPIDSSSKYCFGSKGRWLGVSGESLAARNPHFGVY